MKFAVSPVLPLLAALLLFTALPAMAATPPPSPGEGADIYQQQVQPLTTLECAKCHFDIFKIIRDEGGQHQLECRDCHNKFHTFTPGVAWKDRVPACNDCHEGVHEGSFPECLSCHRQAHAPLASLVDGETLAADCGQCHSAVNTEIEQFASAHTELGCIDCHHDRHGFKPGCDECHPQPHTAFRNNAECIGCHQPHSPLQITFGDAVGNGLCQGCHADPAATLAAGKKKHTPLHCVFCHANSHGTIPACQDCHGNGPHNPELLQGFKGCLECHGDPHSLTLSGS
ncbi:MAG: cytochrome c3 family protein [Desulfuromonadaceae bacterium]